MAVLASAAASSVVSKGKGQGLKRGPASPAWRARWAPNAERGNLRRFVIGRIQPGGGFSLHVLSYSWARCHPRQAGQE